MAQQVSEDDGSASTAAPAAGLRVLVVEDEALIRLDLAEMLTEEGYVVAGEAGDGEQALELARRLHPDLVIMDVKMPKMDGITAATSIVEERIAPVVMLTAFSQRDLIEQARDAGAMAYLVKPFARHELVPAIELAVSRFAEKRALEDEVATLSERLETRKVVDRAKGLLMTRQQMTEPEAFRWIQRTAMDRRHDDEGRGGGRRRGVGDAAGVTSPRRPQVTVRRRIRTLCPDLITLGDNRIAVR